MSDSHASPFGWARPTGFTVGTVEGDGPYAVMLRIPFRCAEQPGAAPLPEQSTPELFLTEGAARDLIRLLHTALGDPAAGMQPTTSAKH